MKFTVDYDTLESFLRVLTKGRGKKFMKSLRLWACDARMFISTGFMTAGTEALVLEDGGCTVARTQFVSLFRIYGHKKNITIEAKPGFLQIEDERIRASNYLDDVTAPGDFRVFPVTDTDVVSGRESGTRRASGPR